jgi:hypothetical protein
MNALCALETIEFNSGANLLARSLDSSFAKVWVRLIGRKSPTDIASAFLGTSTIWVVFN